MPRLSVPPATANPVDHADWMELEALAAADRNSSIQDLSSALRRLGSGEEIEDEQGDPDDYLGDKGGETLEPVAEAAFEEVEDRTRACGGAYPFALEDGAIQGTRGSRQTIYTFLLLVSLYGKDAGPTGLNVAKIFEELAEVAILNCLGGSNLGVETFQFGFPRRLEPAGFEDALNELCARLGEGTKAKKRPTTKNQKDAALDLVAWRPFPDGRRGQLMAWGQCATGADWREKLTEMQPHSWASTWMVDMPTVLPLRTFFVPHRLRRDQWDEDAYRAGIIFDRCRIAALTPKMPKELRAACRQFNKYVLTS